ncbi:MAG: hypothetical protein JXP48_06350, partial [Acidobacteria bacterium]|nr:hypothetical protein [Acidobacteriota bacterium]
MAVGIGMTIPGSKAVLEGALGIQSPFVRTPKFSVDARGGEWMSKKYRCDIGVLTLVEILFGAWFTFVIVYAWNSGIYAVIPFLFLFQFGYLYMGLWAIAQSLKRSVLGEAFERLIGSLGSSRVTGID